MQFFLELHSAPASSPSERAGVGSDAKAHDAIADEVLRLYLQELSKSPSPPPATQDSVAVAVRDSTVADRTMAAIRDWKPSAAQAAELDAVRAAASDAGGSAGSAAASDAGGSAVSGGSCGGVASSKGKGKCRMTPAMEAAYEKEKKAK